MSPGAAWKIADDVWSLALPTPTLPPATTTNTMLLGRDRLVVIEAATPDPAAQDQIVDLLHALESEGREVVALCMTHHHVDHIGAVMRLRSEFDVPVVAETRTANRVGFGVDEIVVGDEIGATAWSCDLGGGMRVEAIYTPGHADGHLVYWEPDTAICYAGDMVAGEGTILIDRADGGDMSRYLESLEAVKERCGDARTVVFPSHGRPSGESLEIVRRTIRHRLAREARIVSALKTHGNQGLGFDVLLTESYADSPRAPRPLAALALDAHVHRLEVLGVVVRRGERIQLR